MKNNALKYLHHFALKLNSNVLYLVIYYCFFFTITEYLLLINDGNILSFHFFVYSIFTGTCAGFIHKYAITPRDYTITKRIRIGLLLTIAIAATFLMIDIVYKKML